jgi:formylglycine-generating enzyme
MNRSFTYLVFLPAAFLVASLVEAAVTIDWSPVGDPGNPADTTVMADGTTGYGSVPYVYNIGTYDVTVSQYVDFLNTKDPTGANTLGLYNASMSDATHGGINFSAGNAYGDKYSVITDRGQHPINYVNWYDAARFANWLNNGQGNGDTETGAYTLLGGTPTPSNGVTVTRNPGATIFLPSENEWHKAAYYNPVTNTYFKLPTSSDSLPSIAVPPTSTPNTANFNDFIGTVTDVGAYSGTTSPAGAFDMAGNVQQWNESVIIDAFWAPPQTRGIRGGDWFASAFFMTSDRRYNAPPAGEFENIGFRVASIPEPSALILAAVGGLTWLVCRRRGR